MKEILGKYYAGRNGELISAKALETEGEKFSPVEFLSGAVLFDSTHQMAARERSRERVKHIDYPAYPKLGRPIKEVNK